MIKRLLFLGLLLTIILVAVNAYLTPSPSKSNDYVQGMFFQNGALDKDHAKLSCDRCHTPLNSFEVNRSCVDGCHEAEQLSPVETFKEVKCVLCHGEHKGADADWKKVSETICQTCHNAKTVHTKTPVKLAKLAEKKNVSIQSCPSCHLTHEAHKKNKLQDISMLRKHLVATHRKGSPLFHKDSCTTCHQDIGTRTNGTASIPGFVDPHATHVGRLNIRCTWCHDTVDIPLNSGATMRRTTNPERCTECHAGEYYAKSEERKNNE